MAEVPLESLESHLNDNPNPNDLRISQPFDRLSVFAQHFDMSGVEKAAILVVTLGLDNSAEVFKHLKEEDIEKIIREVAKITTVPIGKRDLVVSEAYQRTVALKYIHEGGVEYAREILERTFGSDRADDLTGRLFSDGKTHTPFETVKNIEPEKLAAFVVNEQPQTLALIVLYMDPEQGGQMLNLFPKEIQAEVAARIALIQQASPEVLDQIENMIGSRLTSSSDSLTREGGAKALARLLGFVDRATEKTILDGLSVSNPEIASEVKSMIFVFEDFMILDDKTIQRILREVNGKDLSLALKGASEELSAQIMKNMSARSAETLKEDIEALGQVRSSDVGKAQTAIVQVVRALEENGDIVIIRDNSDEQIS